MLSNNDIKMPELDLKDIMNTWSNQMGYPLVYVDMQPDGSVSLYQHRFLTDADHPKQSKFVSHYGLDTKCTNFIYLHSILH